MGTIEFKLTGHHMRDTNNHADKWIYQGPLGYNGPVETGFGSMKSSGGSFR